MRANLVISDLDKQGSTAFGLHLGLRLGLHYLRIQNSFWHHVESFGAIFFSYIKDIEKEYINP